VLNTVKVTHSYFDIKTVCLTFCQSHLNAVNSVFMNDAVITVTVLCLQ
jgi:hypothetical protein